MSLISRETLDPIKHIKSLVESNLDFLVCILRSGCCFIYVCKDERIIETVSTEKNKSLTWKLADMIYNHCKLLERPYPDINNNLDYYYCSSFLYPRHLRALDKITLMTQEEIYEFD